MRKCENSRKIAENAKIVAPNYQTGQPSSLGKRAALAALGSDLR
jgi:hypothetical protein